MFSAKKMYIHPYQKWRIYDIVTDISQIDLWENPFKLRLKISLVFKKFISLG